MRRPAPFKAPKAPKPKTTAGGKLVRPKQLSRPSIARGKGGSIYGGRK